MYFEFKFYVWKLLSFDILVPTNKLNIDVG